MRNNERRSLKLLGVVMRITFNRFLRLRGLKMHANLARTFIERKIIQKGTMVEAYYHTKGISGQFDSSVLGTFRLIGAQSIGDWIFFDTIGPNDIRYRIRCDNVVSLDGMPVNRIAASHQLNETGDFI